jgi:hypothetical protein
LNARARRSAVSAVTARFSATIALMRFAGTSATCFGARDAACGERCCRLLRFALPFCALHAAVSDYQQRWYVPRDPEYGSQS